MNEKLCINNFVHFKLLSKHLKSLRLDMKKFQMIYSKLLTCPAFNIMWKTLHSKFGNFAPPKPPLHFWDQRMKKKGRQRRKVEKEEENGEWTPTWFGWWIRSWLQKICTSTFQTLCSVGPKLYKHMLETFN